MSRPTKDLSGQVFGRLSVVSFDAIRGKFSYYHCRCECGVDTVIRSDQLTGGSVRSCGCARPKLGKERKW